jgi:hypothetical protein
MTRWLGAPTYIFYIDIQSVLDDDTVGTLLTHATDPIGVQLQPPAIGQMVQVYDEDGNRCYAEVEEADGLWLGLRMCWEHWGPANTFSLGGVQR